jgi:hypothetical protein
MTNTIATANPKIIYATLTFNAIPVNRTYDEWDKNYPLPQGDFINFEFKREDEINSLHTLNYTCHVENGQIIMKMDVSFVTFNQSDMIDESWIENKFSSGNVMNQYHVFTDINNEPYLFVPDLNTFKFTDIEICEG